MRRRVFLAGPCFAALGGAAVLRAQPVAGPGSERPTNWPGFPRQDPAAVAAFVGACHRDIDQVKTMLAQHPALAACAYDWGFGDWESPLGAASHTGRREIALLLLEHGARPDIFAAAMLGMTDVVRALVTAMPGVERTRGPHGITLLAHALTGGYEDTIAYVKSLPGATREEPTVVEESEIACVVGDYREPGGTDIRVARGRTGVTLKVGNNSAINLFKVGAHQFHPAGAPRVRVTFTVADGAARRVEVVEDGWFVWAARV